MATASQLTCGVITPCSNISTLQAAKKERAAILPEYIKVKCQWHFVSKNSIKTAWLATPIGLPRRKAG
jgi:hypothetical protein